MLTRELNLSENLQDSSYFFFGAKSTGKSTFIKHQLTDVFTLNLLDANIYATLARNPNNLEKLIYTQEKKIIAIDEIQLLPALLNEVHNLIENKNIHFLLTGSSARKLKSGRANLLAGRALLAELFPLTYKEIPAFSLQRYLQFGGLPMVYLGKRPKAKLSAYANLYLTEEIKSEAIVRKIPSFTKFLHFAALSSGKILNFANIANDTGIAASTIREYYYILEDTFMGFMLPVWTKTIKRKAVSKAKFYFFDIGVRNALAKIEHLEPNTDIYGQAFEHFIACELRAYISYKEKFLSLSYWQSKTGIEVDFIVGERVAIEVKSTNNIQKKHLKGLQALKEEQICQQYFLVSQNKINLRYDDNIDVLYWKDFLDKLWGDLLF